MNPLRLLRVPAVALVLIAILAGGLRLYHLGHPSERVFDEVYYSKDGCLYAGLSRLDCDLTSSGERYWFAHEGETSWVHPPLGKWMIAAGIAVFGNDPFGWRIAAAIFGTATVVILAGIAYLLTRSVLWAYVAGLLLATENLNFVQSRMSMLDIFLAFWVVLGFLFLLLDRRSMELRAPPRVALSPGPGAMALERRLSSTVPVQAGVVAAPILRPWRLAAGVAFGAAFATKWSGVYAIAGAVVLAVAWEISRRRQSGVPHAVWRTIQQEAFGLVLAFLVLPVAVYLASHIGFFLDRGFDLGAFWERQRAGFDFHNGLMAVNDQGDKTHPYESTPWSWILMLRPVSYYFQSPGAEVLGMGNPLIVWSGLATIPYLAYAWGKRRDWRAGLILVAILAQYLVWFPFWNRVQFFFYMTPITPFLVLAAVYALKDLTEYRGSRENYPLVPLATGLVALSVAFFAFFYPVLTGWHLSYDAWHARMWMKGWI